MNEIRVELRDFVGNILGNLDITSSENFPLSLSFQNFDARNITQRGGSFSKTFKVPATKNNNVLFNHIYKDGNIDSKNVRRDLKAAIYSDNIPIVYGTIRLTKLTKDTEAIEYDCIFLGDNMDWANAIKNLELKDMRFSSSVYADYLDLLNGNITPTFEKFLDCQDLTQHPFDHKGYTFNQDKLLYPLLSVGEGVSPKDHVTDLEFIPCLYLKNIWDKVFQGQGYSVESEFCNSDFFKSLIVPLEFERQGEQQNTRSGKIFKTLDDAGKLVNYFYNVAAPRDAGNEARAVGNPSINSRSGIVDSGSIDVSATAITTTQYARYAFFGDENDDAADLDPDVQDYAQGNVQSSAANNALGSSMLVVNESGSHQISWDVNIEFGAEDFDVGASIDRKLDLAVHAEVWKVNLDDDPSDLYYDDVEEAKTRITGSQLIWKSDTNLYELSESDVDQLFDITFSGEYQTISSNSSEAYLFVVVPRLTSYPSDDSGNMQFIFREGSKFEVTGSSTLSIGEDITEIQYMLPNGKQSDFVSGVANLFNLQFTTDAANKIVTVEPYDYFYSFSGAKDWTDKVDYSKQISEEFIYDIKSKLVFKYKDASNDAFLERYNKKNDVDWGAYEELSTTGEFVDGEYKVENKFFSPSFNWFEPDYIDDLEDSPVQSNKPFIPMYHKEFSNLSNSPSAERAEKEFGIGARILLLKNQNQYQGGATGIENSVAVGQNGWLQKYSQCDSNVVNLPSLPIEYFCKAYFTNVNVADYNPTGSLYTRAYASIGTYNNTEVFIDQNLSFSDIKQKTYLTSGGSNGQEVITQKGLYSNFYNRMIKQLKAKPRIKNIYLNLNYTDISTLDFRKLVFVDGVYYRINKIVDFKPHLKQPTKVELVEYFELGIDSSTIGDLVDLTQDIRM